MSSILLATTNAYQSISYTQGLLMTYYSHSQSSHPVNQSQMNSLFAGATQLGSGVLNETIHFSDNGTNGGGQGQTKSKPFGWPSDYYAVKFEGYLYAPTTGTYTFGIDGDDAMDLRVNNTRVAHFYDGHGFSNSYTSANNQVSSTIALTGGQYYPFRARFEEISGGDGMSVGWKKPGDSSYSLIPATSFFHIAQPTAPSTGITFGQIATASGNGSSTYTANVTPQAGHDTYLAFLSSDGTRSATGPFGTNYTIRQHNYGFNGSSTVYFATAGSNNRTWNGNIDGSDGLLIVPVSNGTYASSINSSTRSKNPPGISCNAGDALVVVLYTQDKLNPTISPPSGYTLLGRADGGTSAGANASVFAAAKLITSSGTETPGAWTTNASGAEVHLSQTIRLT